MLPTKESDWTILDIQISLMKIGIVYNSFARHKKLPEELELRNTAFNIGRHLKTLGHHIQYFNMDSPESIMALCRSDIEVAFDTCERMRGDPRGEAFTAAFLEFLGIPHTRTSSFYIALGINKMRIKHILSFHHILIPKSQVFFDNQDNLNPGLEFPLFVKGSESENSIGIDEQSFVMDMPHLKEKVSQIINSLHQAALVEEFIDGREFSVAILPGKDNRTLPIMEIEFDDLPINRRYLDYQAKWLTNSDQYQRTIPGLPKNLPEKQKQAIISTALKCFRILGLDSYTRIDMRCRDDRVYVLEVNQNPSIDEDGSGYVRACKDVGLDYNAIINILLANALLGAV